MTTTELDWRWVQAFLTDALGEDWADVEYQPGPMSYQGAGGGTINRAITATVGGGPGLLVEGIKDRVTVELDVAGNQGDPDDAQALALASDRAVLSLGRTTTASGLRVDGVQRAGGRPRPLGVDDGDRWHLACSYVFQIGSGVK